MSQGQYDQKKYVHDWFEEWGNLITTFDLLNISLYQEYWGWDCLEGNFYRDYSYE